MKALFVCHDEGVEPEEQEKDIQRMEIGHSMKSLPRTKLQFSEKANMATSSLITAVEKEEISSLDFTNKGSK